jgi:hypothetical protein
MKPVTANRIFDLLAITPQLQENQVIIEQLQLLANSLNVVEEPFTYTNNLAVAAGANAIAAGVTSAQIITPVDASAMFIIESQSYSANSLNATQTEATHVYPNVSVMITDTGTSKQWMDAAVPIPSIFGDGRFPFFLPKPRIVPANAQIACVYTNFDAAAGFNIRLAFNGYRLYSLGRASQSPFG